MYLCTAVREYPIRIYRGVEQLVARRAHNPKVIGSSPVPATTENTGFSEKKASEREPFLRWGW